MCEHTSMGLFTAFRLSSHISLQPLQVNERFRAQREVCRDSALSDVPYRTVGVGIHRCQPQPVRGRQGVVAAITAPGHLGREEGTKVTQGRQAEEVTCLDDISLVEGEGLETLDCSWVHHHYQCLAPISNQVLPSPVSDRHMNRERGEGGKGVLPVKSGLILHIEGAGDGMREHLH